MDEVLRVLQQFQTAIVGIIGFTGVILTLWWNARLARNVRTEAIKHDRVTLRATLLEELKVLKSSYERAGTELGEVDRDSGGGMSIPLDPLTAVYDQMLTRLGLLSANEIEKVMDAYLSVKQTKFSLLLIRDETRMPVDGWISISGRYCGVVKGMYESLLPKFDAAISVLRSNT
jgi:hypothetical protein